jgi:hypothetical protein
VGILGPALMRLWEGGVYLEAQWRWIHSQTLENIKGGEYEISFV